MAGKSGHKVQEAQQQSSDGNLAQTHAVQLQELQAAHEQQVRETQQAAQQAQADLQAAHAIESRIVQEAHIADMARLKELQDALPQQLPQDQAQAKHPQDLSTCEIGMR